MNPKTSSVPTKTVNYRPLYSSNNVQRVLTPASDYAFGWGEARQLIWTRAGADYLTGYNPTTAGDSIKRVDTMRGDGEETFTTNPRSFPDTFILGDYNIPYYVNPGESTLQFAIIDDFTPTDNPATSDVIRLYGEASDYQLKQTTTGTQIFWKDPNTGKGDLIAKVKNVSGLDLNASYFQYLGNTPPPPSEPKIYQFGTISREIVNGISTDSSGSVYVTGSTGGDLDGSGPGQYGGNLDSWVAKYDSTGNLLWLRQFGGPEYDSSSNILVDDQGNVILNGQTTGNLGDDPLAQPLGSRDYWIREYDTDGNLLWYKQPYSSPVISTYVIDPRDGYQVSNIPETVQRPGLDVAFGLATDSDGYIYQGGLSDRGQSSAAKTISQQILGFQLPAEDDFFLNKWDAEGNLMWHREYGEFGLFDEQYDVAVDSQRNAIYASGWTYGKLGTIDNGLPTGVNDPEIPSDLVANPRFYDAWLGKFDTETGDLLWMRQFGSKEFEFTWGTEIDSQGNIYAAGWTYGNVVDDSKTVVGNTKADIWIAKFDPDGNELGRVQFGSPGDDVMILNNSFSIGPDDNLYLSGYTDGNLGGTNAGSTDIWVSKFAPNLDQLWTQQLGTPQADFSFGLTSDGNSVYVSGYTEGSLGAVNLGATDAIMAKLDAGTGELLPFIGSPYTTVESLGVTVQGGS